MKLAIACLLCGCGSGMRIDEPLPEIDDCQLALELGGAITSSYAFGDDVDCAGALDAGGDPIIAWFPPDEAVMRLDLSFDAAFIGVTGSVPGTLDVISPSGFVWSGACDFQIDHWNDTGTAVGGSGACNALEPESGTATVSVGRFDFDML